MFVSDDRCKWINRLQNPLDFTHKCNHDDVKCTQITTETMRRTKKSAETLRLATKHREYTCGRLHYTVIINALQDMHRREREIYIEKRYMAHVSDINILYRLCAHFVGTICRDAGISRFRFVVLHVPLSLLSAFCFESYFIFQYVQCSLCIYRFSFWHSHRLHPPQMYFTSKHITRLVSVCHASGIKFDLAFFCLRLLM